MKNKRYKREAKRLIGYCLSVKCYNCKYYSATQDWDGDYVFDCSAPSYLPAFAGIRIVEKEFKKDFDKRLKYKNKK